MNKNTFAPRPPMGWNSYDYYDTTVNEEQVKQNADYMAAHLKSFGWEYVVVDIQWYASRPGTMRDKFQYIPFSHLEMDEYSRLLPISRIRPQPGTEIRHSYHAGNPKTGRSSAYGGSGN